MQFYPFCIQELQHHHEEEVERLNRKLKWYAENQQLLDHDADLIKHKDEEIKSLKDRLDNITSEVRVNVE